MGTSTDPWAYDNERPAHVVDAPGVPHRHDPGDQRAPTPMFIADGGYDDPQLVDRRAAGPGGARPGSAHPQFWTRVGRRTGLGCRFGRVEPVPEREPVQHVCWFEADAYAPLARRAPADRGRVGEGGERGDRRRWPVPRRAVASVPTRSARTPRGRAAGAAWTCSAGSGSGPPATSRRTRASARSRTASTRRCSSAPASSERGPAYKVLRGGSWATDPIACSTTFRNWDLPIRRQIFAGFRCAIRRLSADPCAATSRTSVPRSRSGRCCSTRRTRSCTRPAPRSSRRSGRDNPDGWGVGWSFAGDSRAEHQRYRAGNDDVGGLELRG